jgi:hypothetical protein
MIQNNMLLGNAELTLRTRFTNLIKSLSPEGSHNDRRRDARYPFPHQVYVTLLEDDGATPTDDSLMVTGKHISANGLGFTHQHLIPQRRIIVSVQVADEDWIGILMDLTWCRFTQQGCYESGGRFISLTDSPVQHLS